MTDRRGRDLTGQRQAIQRRDRARRWVVGLTAAVASTAVAGTTAVAAVLAVPAAASSQSGESGQSGQSVGQVSALRAPQQPLTQHVRTGAQPTPAATSTGS